MCNATFAHDTHIKKLTLKNPEPDYSDKIWVAGSKFYCWQLIGPQSKCSHLIGFDNSSFDWLVPLSQSEEEAAKKHKRGLHSQFLLVSQGISKS